MEAADECLLRNVINHKADSFIPLHAPHRVGIFRAFRQLIYKLMLMEVLMLMERLMEVLKESSSLSLSSSSGSSSFSSLPSFIRNRRLTLSTTASAKVFPLLLSSRRRFDEPRTWAFATARNRAKSARIVLMLIMVEVGFGIVEDDRRREKVDVFFLMISFRNYETITLSMLRK